MVCTTPHPVDAHLEQLYSAARQAKLKRYGWDRRKIEDDDLVNDAYTHVRAQFDKGRHRYGPLSNWVFHRARLRMGRYIPELLGLRRTHRVVDQERVEMWVGQWPNYGTIHDLKGGLAA